MFRSTFVILGLALTGCASTSSVETSQVIEGRCIILSEIGGRTAQLCPVRTNPKSFTIGEPRGYCHMSLTVRPDGSVSTVRKLGGSMAWGSYCRESMFGWRFSVSDLDGQKLAAPISGLEVVLAFENAEDRDDSLYTESFEVRGYFDPVDIARVTAD